MENGGTICSAAITPWFRKLGWPETVAGRVAKLVAHQNSVRLLCRRGHFLIEQGTSETMPTIERGTHMLLLDGVPEKKIVLRSGFLYCRHLRGDGSRKLCGVAVGRWFVRGGALCITWLLRQTMDGAEHPAAPELSPRCFPRDDEAATIGRLREMQRLRRTMAMRQHPDRRFDWETEDRNLAGGLPPLPPDADGWTAKEHREVERRREQLILLRNFRYMKRRELHRMQQTNG